MRNLSRQVVTSPTLRTITGLASGNSLAMVVGILGGVVQARFITPEELGYFRSFSIITGYVFSYNWVSWASSLDIYPYYLGKGERDRAIAVAEICQAWIVMVTIVVSSVYIMLALHAFLTGNGRAGLAWFVQVVAITGFFYGGFLGATYRSGHDFNTVTRGSLISTFVNLLTLPIFFILPYIALVLRSSAGSLSNLIFLASKSPVTFVLALQVARMGFFSEG